MIPDLAQFFRRSPADQRLLVHAFVLHAAIDRACAIVPFGRVVQALAWLYPRSTRLAATTDRVIWAVRAVGVRSRSTCLTRALTAQALLRYHGRDASLQIGVARRAADLRAHAWLEANSTDGSRVILGATADRFARIWAGE